MKATLVTGPPCAGKTSYVRERAKPGDVIVDFDTLANALSGMAGHDHPQAVMPFVRRVFRAAVREIARRPLRSRDAWIIRTAPERNTRNEYRQAIPGLRVVVLATDAGTCKERAARERPERWPEIIDDWWRRYEPDPRDEVIE